MRSANTRTTRLATVALVSALAVLACAAGPAAAKVTLKKVGRFSAPTYVTSAPGTPGIFVVEQAGRIVSVQGRKRKTFLDIRSIVKSGGEQGLLSIAFPANYADSGLFYGYYTDQNGSIVIAEFRRASRFKADPAYRRQLALIPHSGQENHNGGQLQFGPDGLLYFGTGDGGGSGDTDNSAQTTNNLLGKMLRIDPSKQGAAPQIFSIGLRNPFRFSFDGDRIVIGDVGQDRFEEIDYQTLAQANGANYGWNDFEGFAAYSGAIAPTATNVTKPIYAYDHAGGRCSVIAGYVSRTKKIPSLRGRLIFGDFCDGILRSLKPGLGGGTKVRSLGVEVPMLSSFGLGQGGALYAASQAGPVYRIRGK